ncbi:MAG: hypothetical protein IT583_02975 [Verrucomicrobia bacterium]|nr:hypothetical protein [Verrucomicrobiota bacterium]
MDNCFHGGAADVSSWIPVGNASWEVDDGALVGRCANGSLEHGQLFSAQTFAGDILLEFYAQTVLPSDHDIIWWWQTELTEDNTSWKRAYLGALGGWWSNRAGIERLDGEKEVMATTPLFKLEPGRKYKIHSGCIDGSSFIFVDGALIIEFKDPDPVDPGKALRIGFGVYRSTIRIEELTVYKPSWEAAPKSYSA